MLPTVNAASCALALAACALSTGECVASVPQSGTQGVKPAVPLRLQLRPTATISGARVTLADVAVPVNGTAELDAAAATLDLGPAPMIAQGSVLSSATVEAVVRRRLPAAGDAVVTGAPSIRLSRASRLVGGKEMERVAIDALSAAFAAQQGRLDMKTDSVLAVEVPTGTLTMLVRPGTLDRLQSRIAVWLDLSVDGKLYRSVVVPVNLALYRPVYEALQPLAAGNLIDSAQFLYKDVNVIGLDRPAAQMPAKSARLALTLPSGGILLEKHIVQAETVLRGDKVTLVSTAGAVVIESTAVALDAGQRGRRVRVQTSGGSGPVYARVISADQVQAE